jgi:putative tricarboxylic transport membrane protein
MTPETGGVWRRFKREIFVAIAAAIGGAGYLAAVAALPRAAISDPLGPTAFPILLGILMLIGAGVQVAEIVLRRAGHAAPTEDDSPRFDPIVLAGIASLIAFALLLEMLGFVVAMALQMVFLTLLLDRTRWKLNLAASIGYAVGVYVLFAVLLGVALPRGVPAF